MLGVLLDAVVFLYICIIIIIIIMINSHSFVNANFQPNKDN